MNFWETKNLAEMSSSEWESLCDGCGKCCLHKIEDEDTDELFYTRIACRLLDTSTCQCSDYSNRLQKVPDCLKLKPEDVTEFQWLPETCAYRLVADNRPLPKWHHLLSGTAESVHVADASVRSWVVSEEDVTDENQWFDLVIVSGKDHP